MTDIYRAAERLMGMQDADWQRHANPLSVWSRFTCLPLLAFAIYARQWIGWWSLPLFMLACLWTWANPRVFPVPSDFGSWATRATLGERIFLARDRYDIPDHHIRASHVLTSLSAIGLVPLAYGLIVLDPFAVLAGLVAIILPKLWFCDRMVWIHAEMTGTTPGTPLSTPLMPPERT
ncbi:MAG: DUF6653 family protein [Tateyamaria sp.]|jgi:hypothetical protein|uniref:DUF6653 family protein n=1 Tax=Tateyamaria sp. TaxID=1929288 RepID=UPI0032DCB2B6